MAWNVECADQFAEWYAELPDAQAEKVEATVETLAEKGPLLGRPYADTLHGSKYPNLKELRIHRDAYLRVLYVFDPRRTAILLLGGDKTNEWEAWYERAIPQAEWLYEEHLEELRKEGLLE